MISERVTSGMRNAAAKGKVIGRLHTTVADIPQRFMKSYPLYEKHKINQSELARITVDITLVLFCIIFTLLYLIIWFGVINKKLVKNCAKKYAFALLSACDSELLNK